MSLPSGYRELEYIQSTGTQYINTGVNIDTSIGFDATIEVLNTLASSPYYNLFGVRGDAASGDGEARNYFRIDTIPVDSNTGTELKYGTTVYNSGITANAGKINIKLLNGTYTKPNGTTISVSGGSSMNLPIFICCINKLGNPYGNYASMKIYNFKLYSGDTLVRDFVPCSKSTGEVGLFDTINNVFYDNSGTSIFLAGPEVTEIKLPSGYRRYSYIQSTGTQYIDTGVSGSGGYFADIDLSISSLNTSSCIIGAHNISSPYGRNNISLSNSKIEVGLSGYETIAYTLTAGTRYYINYSSAIPTGYFRINHNNLKTYSAVLSSSDGGSLSTNNILIGANQYTLNSNIASLSAKWYRIRLFNNSGVLVRDFIPCKNASDAVGLYDIVNNQFYSNAGTGVFTVGSPVDNFKTGDILDFEYSGAADQITLPSGQYKLQCWGAQGGYRSSSTQGKGGYSEGILNLKKKSTVYVYVGGSGNTGGTAGGFNGGGIRGSYPGGGGATDIRIGQDSLYARVIVAGGGGSDGQASKYGGAGGGTVGQATLASSYGTNNGPGNTTYSGSSTSTTATAQSASSINGGFGFGGSGLAQSSGYGGAGGGGWYGGSGTTPDSSGDDDRGGAGGSGYVFTADTQSQYPEGCLLDDTHLLTDASTTIGTSTFASVDGNTETGHVGNGYARITAIKVNNFSVPVKVDGLWKAANNGFVKVDGEWKNIIAGFVKVNGEWKPLASYTLPVLPVKGNLINLDLKGTGNKLYRILKINGTNALACLVVPEGDSYYSEYGSSTTVGSWTVSKYADSDLDTYLNTTWYNTLTDTAKAAIIPTTITQDVWIHNPGSSPDYSGTYGDTIPGTYNYTIGKYSGGIAAVGERNVFALSVQEVMDYLSDENMLVDKTAALRNVNLWKMFWNVETKPEAINYFWLRTAASEENYAWRVAGSNGGLTTNPASYGGSVIPAFTIDLSKISYTIA